MRQDVGVSHRRWRERVRAAASRSCAAVGTAAARCPVDIPSERCLPSLATVLMQYSTLLRPCNAVIHYNKFNRCEVIFIMRTGYMSYTQGHFDDLNYRLART